MAGMFCGAAGVGGATAITLSVNWTSPTGASPQTTSAPTATVPTGNPGTVIVTITGTGAANVSVSIAGGSFSAIGTGEFFTVANTNSIAFKLTGASRAASITAIDYATGATIGTSTITNT